MNTKDLFKAVSELNLEPIKMKLMHVQSGEGWSRVKADAVEKEYRRFLVLMKLYPNEDTAPLVDVDTFWHYHILDTMKYAADCERALGGFLHHYPYVGLRGEADQQFRIDSGERMRALYECTFNEAYPGSRTPAADAARTLSVYTDPYFEQRPAALDQTAAATAWCAGPHDRVADGPATKIGKLAASAEGAVSGGAAWCAGPHANRVGGDTAWCAGPHINRLGEAAAAAEGAVSGGTAWCAGPHTKHIGGDTAWCAGPHDKAAEATAKAARPDGIAVGGETAWCAGPHGKTTAGNGGNFH